MASTPPPPSPIVLIGDSTLDNILWVMHEAHDGAQPLRSHLERLTKRPVINLAADAFTTTDVLRGSARLISAEARLATGDPFPSPLPGTGRAFQPLAQLHALLPPHPPAAGERSDAAVVLSVGGNDVREVLGAMHELPARLAALQANYPRILAAALASTPRVVIIMQYCPALDDDGIYGVYAAMARLPGPGDALSKLHGLLEEVYAPILALAKAHGLPVVDLPRSFDPRQKGLYRCQIEPSSAGGELIAALVAHALQHHAWGAGCSRLYVGGPGAADSVMDEVNDGSRPWRVGIAPVSAKASAL